MFKWLIAMIKEKNRSQAWEIEQKFLWELKNCLDALGTFPKGIDGFQYAVDFFNALVTFREDFGTFQNAPISVREEQKALNRMLFRFGTRKVNSFNRASEYEKVSLENTYWGRIYGILDQNGKFWMESGKQDIIYQDFAKKWLERPDPSDKEHVAFYQKFLNPPTYMVIIEFQVRPFIEDARNEILKLCDALLAA